MNSQNTAVRGQVNTLKEHARIHKANEGITTHLVYISEVWMVEILWCKHPENCLPSFYFVNSYL